MSKLSKFEFAMQWSPERQSFSYGGLAYVHEGATITHPSHDLAHLLVAAASTLPWLPRGRSKEKKVAEYNTVFLESVLYHSFECVTEDRHEPHSVATRAREYTKWFVEQHYAPFPLTQCEAEHEFFAGLDSEAVVRLAPIYFEHKRKARECEFMKEHWSVRFRAGDTPGTDAAGQRFQALVRDTLSFLVKT